MKKDRIYWSKIAIKALRISLDHHQNQVDKSGMTYFWHPLRVSNSLKGWKLQIVALLHDILEDGYYTIKDFEKYGYLSKSVVNEIGDEYRYCSIKYIEHLNDAFVIELLKSNLTIDYESAKKIKIDVRYLNEHGINDDEIIDAIISMSKKVGEDYDDYLKRVRDNDIARIVKLRDIDDNTSIERTSYLSEDKVLKMTKKYNKAVRFLRDI